MDRWRGGDDARVDAVRLASEYRVDMATLAGGWANWKSRRPRRDLSVLVVAAATTPASWAAPTPPGPGITPMTPTGGPLRLPVAA